MRKAPTLEHLQLAGPIMIAWLVDPRDQLSLGYRLLLTCALSLSWVLCLNLGWVKRLHARIYRSPHCIKAILVAGAAAMLIAVPLGIFARHRLYDYPPADPPRALSLMLNVSFVLLILWFLVLLDLCLNRLAIRAPEPET